MWRQRGPRLTEAPEPEEAVKPAGGSNKLFRDKSVTGEECSSTLLSARSAASCDFVLRSERFLLINFVDVVKVIFLLSEGNINTRFDLSAANLSEATLTFR